MATLKISDLSVGDWVRYRDREWEVCSIYQFTGEVGLFRKDSQICESIEDIDPIPITAEILEANGFERSTSQFIVYHTDKVWISYNKPSETWSVTMYINDFTSNLHANILHIHQLQHALRLAGVDKEINL